MIHSDYQHVPFLKDRKLWEISLLGIRILMLISPNWVDSFQVGFESGRMLILGNDIGLRSGTVTAMWAQRSQEEHFWKHGVWV